MRKHPILKLLILAGASILLCRLPVEAGEVRLTNGDRLTGELIRMEKGVLILKTAYADKIKVKQEQVACIVTDKELPFVLKTGEVLIGRAICPETGTIKIVGKKVGESEALSAADLEAINPSPPPPPVTYKGIVTAGGSRTTGNTDTAAVNASGKFQARSKRHRFTLEAKYNYAESEDEMTARNYLGGLKYDFFVTEKVYSYAQALFERDDFQDINLRTTTGVGVGYQFLDSERVSLFSEAGVSYFNEDFEEAEDDHFTTGRWSVGFDYEVLMDRVKFFHFHEGYYSLEESDSYYIRSEQGFRLTIVRNFFANFQVDWRYNSQPAPGREKSDTAYIFGLGYEHNF